MVNKKTKEEQKSHIHGEGFGHSHVWIRGGTNQGGFGQGLTASQKATAYMCPNCGSSFSHQYDVVPNIFQAIENAGVVDVCPNNK